MRVHGSWFVIFGLLTWSLAVGYFPQVLPGVPLPARWTKGLPAALLLFGSVFLHELSHSGGGSPLRDPGLGDHPAHLRRWCRSSSASRTGPGLVIAIVGSLTSFAIAVILTLAAALFDVPPGARAIMGKSPLGDPDGESGGLGVRVHPDGPK